MNKKTFIGLSLSFAMGFYATFVLMYLWNWFAVPACNFPQIGYWAMYGLYTLCGLLFSHAGGGLPAGEAKWNWKVAFTVLDLCIPEEKITLAKEEMEELAADSSIHLGWVTFQRIGELSLLLLGGAVVHALAQG